MEEQRHDAISEQVANYLSEDPYESYKRKDVLELLRYLRQKSSIMTQLGNFEAWLVDLIDTDKFSLHYAHYIDLLSETSPKDYISQPGNLFVCNFLELQQLVWNLTDKLDSFCLRLINKNIHGRLFRLIGLPQFNPSACLSKRNARILVHSSIGVLHNLVNRVPTVRSWYRKCDCIPILKRFLESANWNIDSTEQPVLAYFCVLTAVLLLLSFLVSESENGHILAKDEYFIYLLRVLDDALSSPTLQSFKDGYGAAELLAGLQNLAGPDQNKQALLRNGAFSHIKKALDIGHQLKFNGSATSEVEAHELTEKALELLWCLSFVPDCADSLLPGSEFRRIIDRISEGKDWPVNCQKAARGICWNVNKYTPTPPVNPVQISAMMSTERFNSRRGKHLMISYKHTTQDLMLKVCDELRRRGYIIWIDIEHQHGSFVDAMAEGIEQAAGVILGISQDFKNSPHCRQEVKYAYSLGIPLFPIQLEPDFTADGWLEFLLATLDIVTLTDESMVSDAVDLLTKQLGLRGHRSECSPCSSTVAQVTRQLEERSAMLSVQEKCSQSQSAYHDEHTMNLMDRSNGSAGDCESNNEPCTLLKLPTSPLQPSTQNSLSPSVPWHSPLSQLASVYSWSETEVCEWLNRVNLSAYQEAFSTVNGPLLVELACLRQVASDALCENLSKNFGMTLTDLLRLFAALKQLSAGTV